MPVPFVCKSGSCAVCCCQSPILAKYLSTLCMFAVQRQNVCQFYREIKELLKRTFGHAIWWLLTISDDDIAAHCSVVDAYHYLTQWLKILMYQHALRHHAIHTLLFIGSFVGISSFTHKYSMQAVWLKIRQMVEA